MKLTPQSLRVATERPDTLPEVHQALTGPIPRVLGTIARPCWVADWPDRKKTTYHDTEQRAARTGAPLVWRIK